MPDGSTLQVPARVTAAIERTMKEPDYRAAAAAWLAHIQPDVGLQADDGGFDLHFRLFARDSRYWLRLCALFTMLGMSDGR
jgi:hypothetical protein